MNKNFVISRLREAALRLSDIRRNAKISKKAVTLSEYFCGEVISKGAHFLKETADGSEIHGVHVDTNKICMLSGERTLELVDREVFLRGWYKLWRVQYEIPDSRGKKDPKSLLIVLDVIQAYDDYVNIRTDDKEDVKIFSQVFPEGLKSLLFRGQKD